MSNQNNRLQQNQQATSQSAAVGGAPPFMHPMVMPERVQRTIHFHGSWSRPVVVRGSRIKGFNPGFFQPVYLMDHNNQIHMVNIQVISRFDSEVYFVTPYKTSISILDDATNASTTNSSRTDASNSEVILRMSHTV